VQIFHPPVVKLKLGLKPSTVKLGAGAGSGALKVVVKNRGNVAAKKTKVCAKAPDGKLKLSGKRCRTIKRIKPGKAKRVKVGFRVIGPASGPLGRINVTAKSAGVKKKVKKKAKVSRGS